MKKKYIILLCVALLLTWSLFIQKQFSTVQKNKNWNQVIQTQKWEWAKSSITVCTPWGEKDSSHSLENTDNKYCENRNIPKLVEIQSINNGQAGDGEDFLYYVDYPVLSWSTIDSVISSDIQIQIEDFKKMLKNYSSGSFSHITPEFYGSFKIFSSPETNSILYKTYRNSWGANGENNISSYVIDTQWKRVYFDDMFENRKLFEQDLQSRLESDPRIYSPDDVQRGLRDFYKNPKFFLNHDKIIFVFEKYLIAPGSAGNIMIDFPRTSEKNYFKSNIQHSKKIQSSVNPPSPKKNIVNTTYASSEGTQNNPPSTPKNNSRKKYVALTFDDGPSKTQTPRLLEILKENNIHATFYILGKNASFFPDIIKDIHNAGHEIGSHTWDHPQLTRLSTEDIKAQRDNTDNVLKNIIWEIPKTFRPPYGAQNEEILKLFKRPSIMWSIDPQDWKYKSVSHNISAATSPAADGAIILFHDIHKASVDSIDTVIKKYKAIWYEFLTISELLEKSWKNSSAIQTCYSAYRCK